MITSEPLYGNTYNNTCSLMRDFFLVMKKTSILQVSKPIPLFYLITRDSRLCRMPFYKQYKAKNPDSLGIGLVMMFLALMPG